MKYLKNFQRTKIDDFSSDVHENEETVSKSIVILLIISNIRQTCSKFHRAERKRSDKRKSRVKLFHPALLLYSLLFVVMRDVF